MKKLAFLICAVILVVLIGGTLTACGEAKPSEPVVLKFASAATGPYIDSEQAFADAFNERCGPDYTIMYYPSGEMLSFPELLDGVRTGAADMGAVTPSANSADEPKLGANELPFLFNNIQAEIYAVSELKSLFNEVLEDKFNQKLLCMHNYTAIELLSTKPVKTLEDWKGLLVQAISPTTAAVIEALGGAAVTGVPYTESYSVLEKGTAEGVITAPAAMNIFLLTDVAKYMSSCYMIAALHGFSINLDSWNKLPKNIQDIMLEEAQKTSDNIDQWLVGEWDADFARLAEAGVEVYYVPQSEIDRWKAACQSYTDEQLDIMGDFGEKVMDIADEANQKYPR
jgi:TRAP-type C4-dicarboxylate transport system substrate-binding protein